jgi:hypothetical protein
LFEEKIAKSVSRERLDVIKRFTFATKKFGKDKRAIHALDCVRALKPIHLKIELLYDLLCEAVHPNWLGVTQFREFKPDFDSEADHDELVSATVFQSLLLGHEVAWKIELPSAADLHVEAIGRWQK